MSNTQRPTGGRIFALVLAIAAFGAAPVGSSIALAADAAADARQVRVLVAYYSHTGNTRQVAQAVVEGVKQVSGAQAALKEVGDVSKEDLVNAHAIVLGSPTYYANIPGHMKVALDDWSWKWKVDFTDKVGGAFATGGGHAGGKEHVVVSLLLFMLNNRMIVAGPLYQDTEGEDIWAELGAAAATGPVSPGVDDVERDAGRRVGRRVAELARKLHAK